MIGDFLLARAARMARRRGNHARDNRQWNRAAREYRRYLTQRPEDASIWVQLGHVLSEGGDLAAADRAYRTAWELTPADADLLLCWGHSRKRAGDVQSARELYARSAKIQRSDDVERELEALRLPEQRGPQRLPEPEQQPAPPPVAAGRIEHVEHLVVRGHARRLDGAPGAHVEFRIGGAVVGRAALDASRGGDDRAFKTLLDLDRDSEVAAFRMPDGTQLDGSPFYIGPSRPHHRPTPAAARAEVVKPLATAPADVALIATRARNGALPPHVAPYVAALGREGVAVVLVADTDRPLSVSPALAAQLAGLIVREDGGDRFGAWAHGLACYPALYGAALLLLLDDSVVGPAEGRLADILTRIRESSADSVGLTESHEHGWHVQSYFLALKPAVLAATSLQRFFTRTSFGTDQGNDGPAHRLTRVLTEHGRPVDMLFPSPVAADPLARGWRDLVANGFPFVSLPLVRGFSADADRRDWRGELAAAGFDLGLIDAAVAAAAEEVHVPPDNCLLAHAIPRDRPVGGTPDVDFYGPWNYDGEAGEAARALVAATRRSGARINLHPLRRPFGSARPRGPAVEVIDFPGTADIALVALDRDDWALLTDDQREAFRAAPHRIAWCPAAAEADMAPMPSGLRSIDRIWAPDAQSAARLAAATDAPIDVIALSSAGRAGEPGAAAAAAIRASLRATIDRVGSSPVWPEPAIEASLLAGVRFEDADLGEHIRPVPLTPAGAPLASGVEGAVRPAGADDWIAVAPTASLVTPLFARIVADWARDRPDVDIFYGDDFAAETDEPVDQIRLKPEFDASLLAAQDYVGAPLIVRAAAFAALGGLDVAMRTAATSDLLFRAHAAGMSIARIPEILLAHPGSRVRAAARDHQAMLEAQPSLPYAIRPGRVPGSFELARRFAEAAEIPAVTLLVPTRRSASPGAARSHVEQLLAALAETDWPMDRLRVIVGDDVPGAPRWATAKRPYAVRRIETPRAADERFNYAAKMNRLWRAAETEQIVFMNDDVLPTDGGWLKALQTFALDETVGGVGARLLFTDGRLQHAGLVPHHDGAAHAWVYRRRARGTYQDWALVHREWSMVTGAVFATRRGLMERIDGFDEQFSVEFNDSDLCLRLRLLGYRIVYTPHAELTHVEKASRGEQLPPGDERARFLARWRGWLAADPSWHPQLDRERLEVTPRRDRLAWYL